MSTTRDARPLSRDEFFAKLAEKVAKVTEDWAAWEHDVLRNSFRATNPTPRPAVILPPKSTG